MHIWKGLLAAAVLSLATAGCVEDRHGDAVVGVGVAVDPYYDAYYDDSYGPFNDGYWGDDGYFWYSDANNGWHRDEGHHFSRTASTGFHHVRGRGTHREH